MEIPKELVWRKMTRSAYDIVKKRLGMKDVKFEKVIRLRRLEKDEITGRNGPILLTMCEKSEKYEILKNAKKLKYDEEIFRKVIMTPVLTRKEREQDREPRNQLKEKRERGRRVYPPRKSEA